MNRLAIIPARAGSKRLPGKNMRNFMGRPLILHTIDVAIKSGVFTQIMVTSDSDEVLELAAKYNSTRVFGTTRPPELAEDETSTVDVVLDLLERKPTSPDQFALLQPTSPFRTTGDVVNCFNLLSNPNTDSVITIEQFGFPPQLGLWYDDDTQYVSAAFPTAPLARGDTSTQGHEPMYRPNGCVYVVNTESFLKYRSFFKGNVIGYTMDRSPDLDTEEDWRYAEFLAKQRAETS